MPNYLLTNVYNYDNQGEMAQLKSLVDNLRGSFTVVPMVSYVDKSFCDKLGIKICGRLKPLHKLLFILWLGSFVVRAKLRLFLNRELRAYQSCDMILDLGGDTFSDDPHPLQTVLHCCQLLPAIFMKKPYILVSQSIGVFKTSITKKLAKYVLDNARLIIARENITQDYLISQLGIKSDKVKCAIDVAFLLKPTKIEIEKCIGVNPSQIIGRWMLNEKNYVGIMAEIIETLAIKNKVLLIPHVTGFGYAFGRAKVHDDRIIADEIYNRLESKNNVEVIREIYESDYTKGIISNCKIFIGARFHACLSAISQGIPTLVLAYSQKSVGMVNQIGLPWVQIVDVRSKTYYDVYREIMRKWGTLNG